MATKRSLRDSTRMVTAASDSLADNTTRSKKLRGNGPSVTQPGSGVHTRTAQGRARSMANPRISGRPRVGSQDRRQPRNSDTGRPMQSKVGRGLPLLPCIDPARPGPRMAAPGAQWSHRATVKVRCSHFLIPLIVTMVVLLGPRVGPPRELGLIGWTRGGMSRILIQQC